MRAANERILTQGLGGGPGLRRTTPPRPIEVVSDEEEDRLDEAMHTAAPIPTPAPKFVPKPDEGKSARRGMDTLREQALQNLIAKVEDRGFGGLRRGTRFSRVFSPSRIMLLAVALIAAGIAAYLASQIDRPVPLPAVEEAVVAAPPPTQQVLVAKDAIGMGQKVTAAALEWVEWPEKSVLAGFVTNAVTPDAITEMSGAVARAEFMPGEPIRAEKLAQPNGGFLATVLDSGKRGVSVKVAAASASGGFIAPNDFVDVVSTRAQDAGQVSETILRAARVLAINGQLGKSSTDSADAEVSDDPAADDGVFSGDAMATLELDATQTELIVNATMQGQLTLVLRSMADVTDPANLADNAANQAIRLSSPFWTK